MNDQIKYIIPIAILVIIIAGGIYYWQKQQQKPENKTTFEDNAGKIAGVSLEGTSNVALPLEQNQQTDLITDSNVYQYKISEIRKSVNEAMYDLIDKSKYRNKFSKEDVLAAINTAREKCAEGKKNIEELKIDQKFAAVNAKHLQAVQYLSEAVEALKQLYDTGESKYGDEFNLKIDYSNREIKDLVMPK